VLVGIPVEIQEDFVEAKFYCLHALAATTSAFGLARRCCHTPSPR